MEKKISKPEIFNFGPWTVTCKKGSILTAKDNDRFVCLKFEIFPKSPGVDNTHHIKFALNSRYLH